MLNSLSKQSHENSYRYRCPQRNSHHFDFVQFYFLKQVETTVEETADGTVVFTTAKLSGECTFNAFPLTHLHHWGQYILISTLAHELLGAYQNLFI